MEKRPAAACVAESKASSSKKATPIWTANFHCSTNCSVPLLSRDHRERFYKISRYQVATAGSGSMLTGREACPTESHSGSPPAPLSSALHPYKYSAARKNHAVRLSSSAEQCAHASAAHSG